MNSLIRVTDNLFVDIQIPATFYLIDGDLEIEITGNTNTIGGKGAENLWRVLINRADDEREVEAKHLERLKTERRILDILIHELEEGLAHDNPHDQISLVTDAKQKALKMMYELDEDLI